MGSPFNRARMMMTVLAAAVSGMMAGTSEYAAALNAASERLGPYKSRGKGGKQPHVAGNGSRKAARVAAKKRNITRNRKAHRGVPARRGRSL